MIGRDQGVEVNHLPGRLVTPRHLHPRGPRTDRALRGRLLRKLLEQIRSRHRRLSTSNAIAGNQISVETATGKNSHPLSATIQRPNSAIAAQRSGRGTHAAADQGTLLATEGITRTRPRAAAD